MSETYSSYQISHTSEQVTELLQNLLKKRVKYLERKNIGEINAVYFVTMSDDLEYVLRVSPKERNFNAFMQEAWAFDAVRKVGVSSPEVITYTSEPGEFPEAYMLTRKISGIPGKGLKLSVEQKAVLLKELGRFMSLVHTIHMPGFGFMDKRDNGLRGEYETFSECVFTEIHNDWLTEKLETNNLMDTAHRQRIVHLFTSYKDIFTLPRTSVVHGDLTFNNVVIDPIQMKITGIVDFENFILSDPIMEFRNYQLWSDDNVTELQLIQKGYENKDIFDEHFFTKLYLYEIMQLISLHVYFFERGKLDMVEVMKLKLEVLEKKLERV